MSLSVMTDHEDWMRRCIGLARQAAERGEVPVGALLVKNGNVIAEAANGPIATCDPTAHAEVLALRQAASRIGNYRLPETTLYCSVEPCLMCAGAAVHARVQRIVYGASEPRTGVFEGLPDLAVRLAHVHKFEVISGVLAEECAQLLQSFFRQRRKN